MKKRRLIVAAVAAMAAVPLVLAEFPHGEAWGRRFAAPDGFAFGRKVEKVKSEERDGFTLETWRQANGWWRFRRRQARRCLRSSCRISGRS